MTEESVGEVDHYVWEAFYITGRYDEPAEKILAASPESAKTLIAELANVENEGWQQRKEHLYQLHDTEHHVVSVRRRAVHA